MRLHPPPPSPKKRQTPASAGATHVLGNHVVVGLAHNLAILHDHGAEAAARALLQACAHRGGGGGAGPRQVSPGSSR
jgi:hypothetical protein